MGFGNKKWLPDPSTWKGTWRDDWRLMGQEGYLANKHLEHRRFTRKLCYADFDKCDFCSISFDEDALSPVYAYYAPSERVWICEDCYCDFQPHFQWIVDEIED